MRYSNTHRGRNGIATFAGILAVFLACTSARAAVYESGFVEIGGLDQWIQVRGADE